MTLLIGAWTIGLILSLLALGVFISFRIFDFPDITTEGSITVGAAVAATLLAKGMDPFLATTAGFCGGALAGATTGILHTKFKIHALLAGILGKSNVPLLSETTLATYAERLGTGVLGGAASLSVLGWEVSARDAATLILSFAIIALMGGVLYTFFRTNLGTAMRAAGDNAQMIQALGANVGTMIIIGLALANGLIALSGALLAQYQGFADVQMGIGMVVWGLASVIIGEALIGTQQLGLTITGAVMGSVLFRLLVAIALRAGLDPNDLKLITALFVFAALILPNFLGSLKKSKA